MLKQKKTRIFELILCLYFREDDNTFVRQLIDLHEKYRLMVKECFQSSSLFQKALKEVCIFSCNLNNLGI